jgi:RNA 3'-phosphate cyclase
MIEIDGSYGEGGGQILRYALVYSIFLNKPFRIYNIRKGRPNPGLKAQHLNILKALKMISDSEVKGDEIGSLEVEFKPGEIRGGNIFLDFGTAGSIPLFLQTIFPVGIFSKNPVYLHLKGGTDVPGAPSIDYFKNFTYYKILKIRH